MNKKEILGILMMILLAANVSALTTDDNDLIGYWKLDGSGSSMVDGKTNDRTKYNLNYNGVSQQQTAIANYSSYALGFNGVNDSAANNSLVSVLNSMKTFNYTIACWGSPDYSSAGNNYIISNQGGSNGWGFRTESTPVTAFWVDGGAAGVFVSTSYTSSLFLIRRNDTHFALFINNTEKNKGAVASFDDNTKNFSIGSDGVSEFSQGTFDDCAIWNRSLTDSEISDYYNDGFEAEEVAAPTFSAPTPANNSYNSTNQSINISHGGGTNVNYYLWFSNTSTLDSTHLMLNNVTQSATNHANWTMNISTGDDIFYYKAGVQNVTDGRFSSNTSLRVFTLDTVKPTITLSVNTSFATEMYLSLILT